MDLQPGHFVGLGTQIPVLVDMLISISNTLDEYLSPELMVITTVCSQYSIVSHREGDS